MTHRNFTPVDAGSAAYWESRKTAFQLIREAERAGEHMMNAPMYLHGGQNEDEDLIVIENLGPFDDFDEALCKLQANETAVSILAAQQRTSVHGTLLHTVLLKLRTDATG